MVWANNGLGQPIFIFRESEAQIMNGLTLMFACRSH